MKNKSDFLKHQHDARKQKKAIETLQKHFLSFTFCKKQPTPRQAEKRFNAIEKSLLGAGNKIDGYWMQHLFNNLELIAAKKINKIAVLAQTNNIDHLKNHISDLPEQLIVNAKLLHQYISKTTLSQNAQKAVMARERKKPQEKKDAKQTVKNEWLRWQSNKHLYNSQSEFASVMQTRLPDLSIDTIIKKWIPAWRKELK